MKFSSTLNESEMKGKRGNIKPCMSIYIFISVKLQIVTLS